MHTAASFAIGGFAMSRTIVTILLTGGLLAAAAGAGAQIAKCVDAQGRVEYAAACAPGMTEERKVIRSSTPQTAPAATTSPQKSLAEQDAAFRKRQLERQESAAKAQKERQDADERSAQCERAQAQLRALESGQRIVNFDPKTGERIYLSDEARPAEIAQARKTVDGWCSPRK